MNKPMSELESVNTLFGEDDFQAVNMTTPDYLSFIEEPESWVLKDFEDIISPDVKPLNSFQQ